MQLRPYQMECLESIRENLAQGVTCQGVCKPCGTGKAVDSANLPQAVYNLPGESLFFIAHRQELIDQAANKFRLYNPDLSVEIERASKRACPDADVIVGSVQSLTPKRLKKFDPDRFRIIVVDECHHMFQSQHYQRIMEYFGVHRSRATLSRQKLLVGFSATWRRGDGKGSEHLFDKIVYHKSILDIMRSGIYVNGEWCPYLAPIRCNVELTEINLDKVKLSKTSRDFDTGDLSRTVNTPERNNVVVDAYLEHGENMPAIAFTTDIQHSQDLAKAFCDRGIPFAAVTGDIKRNWREDSGSMIRHDILEDYRKGLLRGVCSCDALTEGTDLPWAAVGLNASPCLSTVKVTQKFGRITRPFPAPEERLAAHREGRDIPWVKPYGIWIDFTDSSAKHNLIQAPTLFGLRPDFQFQGKSVEETVKLIEEAKEKNPTLETRELRSLDDLTRSSVSFAAVGSPTEAVELRKWSSYQWTKEGEGQYALVVRGTHTVIRVKADGEAWGAWAFHMGTGSLRKKASTLRIAIQEAEKLLDSKEKKLLRRDAPWRRESPTPPQCISLFMKQPELRKQFRNGDAFFTYAHSRWEAGEMEYSRGSMADLLNVFLQANRVYGPTSHSPRKAAWTEKAVAGVKARLKA